MAKFIIIEIEFNAVFLALCFFYTAVLSPFRFLLPSNFNRLASALRSRALKGRSTRKFGAAKPPSTDTLRRRRHMSTTGARILAHLARNKSVSDAISTRQSMRKFLNIPVSKPIVQDILKVANQAPSGGNLQPWKVYVLAGDKRDELVQVRPKISVLSSDVSNKDL